MSNVLESPRGAGGGGKAGGASSFVQKPDNLRSADTFEGLLGLCAGPIKGPVRGLKSIRINGTAIEGENGEENFPGVLAFFADGDPLKFPQIVTLKLGAAGAPQAVGVDITNPNPAGTPGPWVSRTLNNTGASAVDLRFIVNQLVKQSKKGIFENTLNLEIQMKPTGTVTWIDPFTSNGNVLPAYLEEGFEIGGFGIGGNFRAFVPQASLAQAALVGNHLKIQGKTSSAYVSEMRISVPSTGVYANKGWDVRVRLIEPDTVDNDPNFEKRLVAWESLTAVFSGELGTHEDWRALSWLQIYGQASDNFNGLPAIDGDYDTKIVSVPPITVFDPLTRLYTGATWDGSWAKSYTNDPAWIINDAISDSISGLAAFVPGAALNKWDALELSKWASEQVPDGAGGFHPRFSLNVVVDQTQRSDEFIRFLAGACGATAWDTGNGQWRLRIDKPQTPVAVFTHENIEGEFAYSHTDVDTRFNEVTVVFLNEEFDYREDWVKVSDLADIAANGRKPTRLVSVGATHRQQALRWGVQRVRTNINEFRMVAFSTNRQGKLLERFDHILLADNSLNNVADDVIRRTTGRLVSRRQNFLRLSDALQDSFWTVLGTAAHSLVNTDRPDGTVGQVKQVVVTAEATVRVGNLNAGEWLPGVKTGSVWARRIGTETPANVLLDVIDSGPTRAAIGSSWRRISATSERPENNWLFLDVGGLPVGTYEFWGGQLENSWGPSPYLSNPNAATPIEAVTVRDPLRLEVGVNYNLVVTVPNPAYNPEPTGEPAPTWQQPTLTIERGIANDAAHRGDVTEIVLTSPLPADVAQNAPVALDAVGLPAIPRVYRVVDLNYDQDGERIAVAAIEVDTGKWAAADAAVEANLQFSFDDNIPPPIAPVGGVFTLSVFNGAFGIKRVLIGNWDRPASGQFDKYRLEYRVNQGPWQDYGFQREGFWELLEPVVGRHELRVYSVSTRGIESLPLVGSIAVEDIPSGLAISFGPSTISALYDFTGATPQDLPKEALYKLQAGGLDVANATWQYRVIDGGVNGFSTTSGWQVMAVDTGVGIFTLSSVEVANSQVEIKGTADAGGSASTTVGVSKQLAAPPATSTLGASQTTGFGQIGLPFNTFVPITTELGLTLPAGKSAVQIAVNLSATMPKLAGNFGPWNIEYKAQRLIGGVWTDVGAVLNSNPDPYTESEFIADEGGELIL